MDLKRQSLKDQPTRPKTVEAAFGLVLRRYRLQRGLTQADLEGESSIDRSFISQLENGQKQACLKTIIHLAYRLGLTPGALIDEVMKETDPKELKHLQ